MKILPRVLLWFCLSLLLFACSDKKKSETSNSIKKYGVLVKDTLNFDTIASKIPNLLKKYDVPAVSVAVIQEGKVVWSFVHGMQSADKIADEQTLFLTASIAKPLTAEVFLRLVSHGKVSLDEPMYKYWLDPDIADDPRAKLLTPRHVLTHQTGFKNWRYLTDDKLRFERSPGMEMGYSGEGLQYLVLFVERKLGRDFNDIAKEVLFIPEGMKNTAMKQQDWYEGRVAAPKFPDGTWREPVIRAEEIGAGGVHTTASDYAKFVASIMVKEAIPKKLRHEQYKVSLNQNDKCPEFTDKPKVCPDVLGFGLGWYIYEYADDLVVGHTGANNGERTLAVFSPDKKSGLVVMTNGANGNYVIYDIARWAGIPQKFIELEGPKKPFSKD